jgi:BMFP domain-containing protein YqiC
MNARITAAELDAIEARIAAVEARLARGHAGQGNASEPSDLTDAKLLLALRTFAELSKWSAQGREGEVDYFNARLSAMEDRVAELEKRLKRPPAV